MSGPTSLADLLDRSETLRRLREGAADRRRLTERIRALLPAAEAPHLLGAHLNRQGELVLVMDSPAWAARMRYSHAQLRKGLEPLKFNGIRVQARPRG